MPIPEEWKERWSSCLGRSGPWFALHDYDADGIASGVLWQHLSQYLGIPSRRLSAGSGGRGRALDEYHQDILESQAGQVFILDLGSQGQPEPELATVYIDHHRGGLAHHAAWETVFDGSQLQPPPCTSLLIYDLMNQVGDFSAHDWIAAVGAISDLGEKAPFEVLQKAGDRYGRKPLRDVASLINSGRRSPQFQPELAAQALFEHGQPKHLLRSSTPAVAQLREGQRQAYQAFQRAKRVAPQFWGSFALLFLETPCRIQGLVAQLWRNRLQKYFVIAVNSGLSPYHVEFSARCCYPHSVFERLKPWFESISGRPMQGHPQAVGGRLSREEWDLLLARLCDSSRQELPVPERDA